MYINHFTDNILEENKKLKRKIELYESDDVIRRMSEQCGQRIRAMEDREKRSYDAWMKCLEVNKELKKKNTDLRNEKESYKKQLKASLRKQDQLERQASREHRLREQQEKEIDKAKEENKILQDKNAALQEELCRLKALLDHDGTTNGIPTSQTPRNKKKVIPNAREKSERTRGGQPGHEKHSMKTLAEEEITEWEEHGMEACPCCGGALEKSEEEIHKDESDYEVRIIRKRHRFPVYCCRECGKKIHARIPRHLKESNQYGAGIGTMALALLDIGFVSVNRTGRILSGMLRGELTPSEGYVGSVQKKVAGPLKKFRKEVRAECLKQKILHWDDTVISMDTSRACFRFYGNEKLALYYAHKSKNAEGIREDGVLQNLTEETCLMHDHLKYNYRKEFLFKNIECMAHLERDLQKIYNDSGHDWAQKLKTLFGEMIHKRKDYLGKGKNSFSDEETGRFEESLEMLLAEGRKSSEATESRYYHTDENNLLKRIEEYRDNYFAWVYDFTLPTTNNEAERGLRMTKGKLKIAGQFANEETAEEFALVRTYTETCRRNGINEFDALERLMSGNPYSVEEILN